MKTIKNGVFNVSSVTYRTSRQRDTAREAKFFLVKLPKDCRAASVEPQATSNSLSSFPYRTLTNSPTLSERVRGWVVLFLRSVIKQGEKI